MSDSDCFFINEFEKKLVIHHAEPEKTETKQKTIQVTMDSVCGAFEVQTKENVELESVFNHFYEKLSLMKLNDKQMNEVLVLSESLIENYSTVLGDSLEDRCASVVREKSEFLCKKINETNSKAKRLKKEINNPLFVEAQRNTIGLRWRLKNDPTMEIPHHYLAHNTFHYVSIKETIISLFKRAEFKNTYLNYNLHEKHTCVEGIYYDYCCGINAKKCELFNDPKTLQFELGIDDFEVCSGLKTKTITHNVTAVYFRIRNLPAKFNSRLDNIHLVALCKVQDLKQSNESFDNIAKRIVSEIRELQTVGIQVDNYPKIKGTLVNICADNLGANGLFGLVKCFNTDGFCRICECTKRGSETQTHEIPELMRKKDDYMQYVQIAKSSDRKNTKRSKGIVEYCLFNDLDYFHIFENYIIDLMHDVNEGIILVFLKFFFDSLVSLKILKYSDIANMVRDHNYGTLSQKNKPSKVNFKKHNLNQNATQSYNLFLNLPFIFHEQKDKMADIWSILEMLLKILQIIYSPKISERDLDRLSNLIPKFLSALVEHGVSLTPKLHNLIHYVLVIRNMGPLIHMWAMRMESKHKIFTQMAKNTTCFKNITETLATRHQQIACLKTDMFSDKIIPSKSHEKLVKTGDFDKYLDSNVLDEAFETSDCLEFLKINSFEYRKGFMVFCDGSIYEIVDVLRFEDHFFLVCSGYKVNEFNDNLNSIDVSKIIPNEYKLIDLAKEMPKPYEKFFLGNKTFVIADTLLVYSDFSNDI